MVAIFDLRNLCTGNSVPHADALIRSSCSTYSSHLIFCKLGLAVGFSASLPSFGVAIRHVLRDGSKEQMLDIATSGVVAFMTYVHPIWNFSVRFRPDHTMDSPLLSAITHLPIPSVVPEQFPVRASARHNDAIIFNVFKMVYNSCMHVRILQDQHVTRAGTRHKRFLGSLYFTK